MCMDVPVSGNYISVVLMPIMQVCQIYSNKEELVEKTYHVIHA